MNYFKVTCICWLAVFVNAIAMTNELVRHLPTWELLINTACLGFGLGACYMIAVYRRYSK